MEVECQANATGAGIRSETAQKEEERRMNKSVCE